MNAQRCFAVIKKPTADHPFPIPHFRISLDCELRKIRTKSKQDKREQIDKDITAECSKKQLDEASPDLQAFPSREFCASASNLCSVDREIAESIPPLAVPDGSDEQLEETVPKKKAIPSRESSPSTSNLCSGDIKISENIPPPAETAQGKQEPPVERKFFTEKELRLKVVEHVRRIDRQKLSSGQNESKIQRAQMLEKFSLFDQYINLQNPGLIRGIALEMHPSLQPKTVRQKKDQDSVKSEVIVFADDDPFLEKEAQGSTGSGISVTPEDWNAETDCLESAERENSNFQAQLFESCKKFDDFLSSHDDGHLQSCKATNNNPRRNSCLETGNRNGQCTRLREIERHFSSKF